MWAQCRKTGEEDFPSPLLTGDPGAGGVQEANGAHVYGTSLWCQVLCEAMHRWLPDAGLAMDLALWLSL